MDSTKNEASKLSDMVFTPAVGGGGPQTVERPLNTRVPGPFVRSKTMCGDHPSFIAKSELNAKESKDDREKSSKLSPSTSRTGGSGERRSEHALRLLEARRRVRSVEGVPRADIEVGPGNRALVQAALGSFRWPPYLLAVWVIVLIVTHFLHCLVTVLERVLPNVKKFCQYFRQWTEDTWKSEYEGNSRICPIALGALTALVYAVYCALYVLHSVALWAVEPLATNIEDKQNYVDVFETKVTEYEENGSKTNLKQH